MTAIRTTHLFLLHFNTLHICGHIKRHKIRMPRKAKFHDRGLDTGDILDENDPIKTVFPTKKDNTHWVDFLANVLQGQESLLRANRSYNEPATVNIMDAIVDGESDFKMSKYQCTIIFDPQETYEPYTVHPFDEHWVRRDADGRPNGGFMQNPLLIDDIVSFIQGESQIFGFFISINEYIPHWSRELGPEHPEHVNCVFLEKTGDQSFTVQHFEPHMNADMYQPGVESNLEELFSTIEAITGFDVTLQNTFIEDFGAIAQGADQFCQTWSYWYLFLRAQGNSHIQAVRTIHKGELSGLLAFMRKLLLCKPLPLSRTPNKALWEFSSEYGGMLSVITPNQFVLREKRWDPDRRKPQKWPSNIL
jgi:hypothetical protein